MWFYLALSSAFLAAISITLNKALLKKISTSVTTWSLFIIPLPIIIVMLFKQGIPLTSTLFYVGTIGSSLVFVAGKMLSLKAIKEKDLSKVAPLVIFTTLFHYVLAWIFLGEQISLFGTIGILCILIGAYILHIYREQEHWLDPFRLMFQDKYTVFYLISTFLVGISAIFDKLAIINTQPNSPLLTLLVENIIMGGILTGYIIKYQPTWKQQIKDNLWGLLLSGLIYGLLSIVVMTAFSTAPVALVTGIKKMQILFILLLSWIIWKDKPSKNTIIATVIMLIGILLIKL